jgi:hypothetical protein
VDTSTGEGLVTVPLPEGGSDNRGAATEGDGRCEESGDVVFMFTDSGEVAKRILDHLGLASTGPPTAPAHRVSCLVDPAQDYDRADATYDV